jgi:transcriptional regulator with XRE-family HTH domain
MGNQHDPELLRQFSIQLKNRRKKKQFTQESFAEEVGISTDYVSKLEMGKNFPTIQVLCRICDVLQTSADSLIFGDTLPQDKQRDLLRLFSQLTPESQELLLKIATVLREHK